VLIAARDQKVLIDIRDNGRGFAFEGRYDHAALTEMKLGPETLKERILQLGGSLAIASTADGAHLQIEIPMLMEG
jgi:signal transduction histidine kinase